MEYERDTGLLPNAAHYWTPPSELPNQNCQIRTMQACRVITKLPPQLLHRHSHHHSEFHLCSHPLGPATGCNFHDLFRNFTKHFWQLLLHGIGCWSVHSSCFLAPSCSDSKRSNSSKSKPLDVTMAHSCTVFWIAHRIYSTWSMLLFIKPLILSLHYLP